MSEVDNWALVEYHGNGEVKIGGTLYGSGPFRLQRQSYDPEAPLSFEAFISPHDPGVIPSSFDFSFEGMVSLGAWIIIPRLRMVRLNSGKPVRLRAQAPEVKIGFELLSSDPESVELSAELTLSEVIPPRFGSETYTDDGRIVGEFPSKPQSIPTSIGTIVVQEAHVFEKGDAHSIETDIRIRRDTATVVMKPESLGRDVEAMVESFRTEVDDLCAILSFLGRRRVEWYAMKAFVTWRSLGEETIYKSADWFRTATEQEPRRLTSTLVAPGVIPADALARMMEGMRSSPISSAIRLSIEYLNSSIRQGPVEARLVSAFTALEALVGAATEVAGSAYTATSNKFGKLASKVRRVIRDFYLEHQLDPDLMAEACEKVSELRRRPIVPRTVAVLADNHVGYEDLWPAGTNLQDGLSAAYRIRNELVHVGQIMDRDAAERARLRIHALTERLVYSIIGGKAEWLNPHAYIQSARLRNTL